MTGLSGLYQNHRERVRKKYRFLAPLMDPCRLGVRSELAGSLCPGCSSLLPASAELLLWDPSLRLLPGKTSPSQLHIYLCNYWVTYDLSHWTVYAPVGWVLCLGLLTVVSAGHSTVPGTLLIFNKYLSAVCWVKSGDWIKCFLKSLSAFDPINTFKSKGWILFVWCLPRHQIQIKA